MAISTLDYPTLLTQAAESVLLELVTVLGAYRDQIVVVGGMVPKLLIPAPEVPHVGTIDVDLALDHQRFAESGYRTLHQLLSERGYQMDKNHPYIYRRSITASGQAVVVQVDMLAGEYGGTGRSRRTQRVQDLRPRKARGADLAFKDPAQVDIHGLLPGGAQDQAKVQVAAIVPFLVMKAIAMRERLKEKDPYDIHYCLRHYPGGLEAVAAQLRPLRSNKLVKEALAVLAEKFQSPNHVGPSHIAAFLATTDPDETAHLKRDAYERVTHLLESSP